MKKRAFVTGASRGIGKSCALWLARAGFDVAITARTVHEGEEREHSATVKKSDVSALPGSLESTAAMIEAAGQEVLMVPADLLDAASLGAAATTVLERWGGVDVLVQNARYIGPGNFDLFVDTPVPLIEKHLYANVTAPLILAKYFIPAMIRDGGGTMVHITTSAAYSDPGGPVGNGGWCLGYGVSKGAMHRIAGLLAVELKEQGIRAFNVQPGFITTERVADDMKRFGYDKTGAPPDVVGAVCAWLATSPDAAEFNGRTIEAQYFCHDHGLLEGWEGPDANHGMLLGPQGRSAIRYDHSGAILDQLEQQLRADAAASTNQS